MRAINLFGVMGVVCQVSQALYIIRGSAKEECLTHYTRYTTYVQSLHIWMTLGVILQYSLTYKCIKLYCCVILESNWAATQTVIAHHGFVRAYYFNKNIKSIQSNSNLQ